MSRVVDTDPTTPAKGTGYLPQLDGARALAVLAVVVFHARGDWLPGGYVGVDVFFVLSGFLITGIMRREVASSGGLSFKDFYVRRALRLFPALVCACALVALGFWLVPSVTDRSATLVGTAAALTYTSSILLASGSADLGWMIHTWSLSVEEYFYLVWPFVFTIVSRRRRPLRAVLLITGAAIAYRLATALFTDWSIQRLSYGPDTRAEQLLIGCALALLMSQRGLRVRLWQLLSASVLIVGFAVLPPDVSGPVYRLGGSSLIALAVAVVIAGLVETPTSAVARALSTRVLVWVGRRSYGIYLYNLPIIGLIAASPVPGPAQVPVKLALTFIIPALSYRFVEAPFLGLKTRFATTARDSPRDPTLRAFGSCPAQADDAATRD